MDVVLEMLRNEERGSAGGTVYHRRHPPVSGEQTSPWTSSAGPGRGTWTNWPRACLDPAAGGHAGHRRGHLLGHESWRRPRRTFAWLDALPGTKILVKGNHDYWWNTACEDEPLFPGERVHHAAISSTTTATSTGRPPCAGPEGGSTRRTSRARAKRCSTGNSSGWRPPSRPPGTGRSSASSTTPPATPATAASPFSDLLTAYGVRACYYGHLHGASHRLALQGNRDGVDYPPGGGGLSPFSPGKNLRIRKKVRKTPGNFHSFLIEYFIYTAIQCLFGLLATKRKKGATPQEEKRT